MKALKTLKGLIKHRFGLIDPLTKLGSKLAFDLSEPTGWIIYTDANGLKELNDTYGHDVGDAFLKSIGELYQSLNANAFRVGGDEFLLIAKTEAEANKAIDSIHNSKLSIACGLAKITTLPEAIKKAESKMYKDKARIKGKA